MAHSRETDELGACSNEEQASKWCLEEINKGKKEIEDLVKEIKRYTEEKCELEIGLMQDECKVKHTQNLYKVRICTREKKKRTLKKAQGNSIMQKMNQCLGDFHKYYNDAKMALMEEFEEWTNKEKQAQKVVDELQRELEEMKPLHSIMMEEFEEWTNKEKQAQKVVNELQRELDEMKPLHSIMDQEANDEAKGE